MRRAVILGIVATWSLVAQSLDADNAETLDHRIERERKANLDAVKRFDIDYQLCAAVVVADAMKDLRSSDTIYLSILGEDPSEATLTTLHKLPASVVLGSLEPPRNTKSQHTAQWSVNVASILQAGPNEYTAIVGYYCGSLCAGATEYSMKKDGNSCVVQSSSLKWAS